MEVMRNFGPENNFLARVRELADKKNIVFIFDECSSGFRETLGGLHLKYDEEPDVATFGKASGNGFGINAVIGKRSIMETAQNSFISRTFWTERVDPVAALATLAVMGRERSWETITRIGKYTKARWIEIFSSTELDAVIGGLDAFPSFNLKVPDPLATKTFITQKMLSRNYLASNLFFPAIVHDKISLDGYLSNCQEVLERLCDLLKSGVSVDKELWGSPCHVGFKRLN